MTHQIEWEPVIGLEVHAQLATQTKLFCRCKTTYGAPPNTQTCPVCLGMPGALPALNKHAVDCAIKAALALGCAIQSTSVWARKNYFYPDLPKGYQISQFDKPYALGGAVVVSDESGQEKTIRLIRIHMEEDAGKNIHVDGGDCSLIDFNRACVPLIEIVSHPDIASPEEAASYLKQLHQIVTAIDVCDGNMEEGSFRCDANVSIRKKGTTQFGTRVEIKNINSFKYITQAIHYEIARQRDVLESGGVVVQETRLWDSAKKMTQSMRRKEQADDYRYFPDPDLPPLHIDDAHIARMQAQLPELPQKKRARFITQYGLPPYDADVLCDDRHVAAFFEQAVAHYQQPKAISNWIMTELLREMTDKNCAIADLKMTPIHLAQLVQLIDTQVISGKIAKEIVPEVLKTGQSPKDIVEQKGLIQVTDTAAIEQAVLAVLAKSAGQIEQYRAGKTNLLGYFVGQVIKHMQGKANPAVVNDLLKKHLG